MKLNETHDPARRGWIAAANLPDTDFPIQNLPLGIFREGGTASRLHFHCCQILFLYS